MVLAAYDLDLSEKRLRELCDWSPQGAVSSTAVVAAARALGFIQSREDYGLRLHDLRDNLREVCFPSSASTCLTMDVLDNTRK